MAYNAIQDNIYNYYLTSYAPKRTTKYDAHKASELRNIYNSMIKLNKESPLYLISNTKETARFAVGLKENARALQNQIVSLGDGLTAENLLNRKVAYSSNNNLASAEYIGDVTNQNPQAEIPPLEMEVQSLASGQTNIGSFLKSDALISLPPDTYSFDIAINDMNYEFQFNIHAGETNRNIQERLNRLINNTGIGLSSDIVEGDNGTSSLRIQSEAASRAPGKENSFSVTDDKTSKTSGMVSYLGLDYVSREASNAKFTLNGEPREAYSNNFTLGKLYEVTLNGVSSGEGDSTSIGLKTDYESLSDNISQLADHFNGFLKTIDSYQNVHSSSQKLRGELSAISSAYKDSLHTIGLNVQDDGKIAVDRDALFHAVQSDNMEERFQVVKNFTQQIYRKTNQISLNPMKYVDKTVVAYKNPGHNFVSPYTSSSYSGMLFNFYC